MTEISEGELLLRLVLACMLGGIIGYERQSRHKSAGLRTNMLVCLGSCLVMVLSQEIYLRVEGHTNADPARLAAQVVSGIGFLGAGAIMKEGLTVTGLTTAACLWVVAGVGLAVGAGLYVGALLTTGLVFATLGVLSRLDAWVAQERHLYLVIHAHEAPPQDGVRMLSIELDVYNRQAVRSAVIAEAVQQLRGVRGVEIG